MKKLRIPYFRFYPEDFMHGVRGLTPQEVGVYVMLLCRMYEENGRIEYHATRLATYCMMRPTSFKKVVNRLIELDKIQAVDKLGKTLLTNRRAEGEISDRANDLKKLSRAGKKSAEKRQQNQKADATNVHHLSTYTDTKADSDSSKK